MTEILQFYVTKLKISKPLQYALIIDTLRLFDT